jgi:hypothetical protein
MTSMTVKAITLKGIKESANASTDQNRKTGGTFNPKENRSLPEIDFLFA